MAEAAAFQAEGGVGQPVLRKEDERLLTGLGCYSDDVSFANQAHAVMLRSPYPNARIVSIDTRDALAVPGVIAVLTGKDMLADGLAPLPLFPLIDYQDDLKLSNSDGSPLFLAPHYALATDQARYVGEAVAMVIAETVAAAQDGAECIVVDYEVLPHVTDARVAAQADSPRVWENAASNVVLDTQVGNKAATDDAFARATHVVKFKTWAQRVTGVPMEPRAALGLYDPATQGYTLYASSAGAVRLRDDLAKALAVPADRVRVVMRDIGGSFGTRGMIYAEFPLIAWAARRVGRPVKWTCERQEAFLTDYQGRDLAVEAELALGADGTFLAMRGRNISNVGAHTSNYNPLQKGLAVVTSVYRLPQAHFRAMAVVTNTVVTRPYRSAGRPEVMYVMERLIDIAARECGFDRVALRLLNLVSPDEQPYRNPFGLAYDSGDYPKAMRQVLELGDWPGFESRRGEARKRNRVRGIAVANYIDFTTGVPRERAEITVQPDGRVDVVVGTVSHGQGHETSFSQVVRERLGVPIEKVRIIAGDTDTVSVGGGTASGRGMRMMSVVLSDAAEQIIDKAKAIIAVKHGRARGDVRFANGRFSTSQGDVALSLWDVATMALQDADVPSDLRGPLSALSDKTLHAGSFPYGSHVCEVEIDPELGTVELARYAAVDDVGRAVNPMIVDGQTHGGIAQGVGQALMEQCVYDGESGQLLTGSFMDYAMPRADNFPFFDTLISEVPSTTHPLGIRSGGEGGITPALGATINAIVDALAEFGVRHVEMPATPERIWRAIQMGERRDG